MRFVKAGLIGLGLGILIGTAVEYVLYLATRVEGEAFKSNYLALILCAIIVPLIFILWEGIDPSRWRDGL